MKLFVLTLTALISMTGLASAKTVVVQGEPARSIMEVLAAANFPVTNIDEEWSGKTLTLETPAITCDYSGVMAPDEWMTNVHCNSIVGDQETELANPLAMAKAIAPYADFEGAAGHRYLSVQSIKCSLNYSERAYNCALEVVGME
jgi:hypothetical protein